VVEGTVSPRASEGRKQQLYDDRKKQGMKKLIFGGNQTKGKNTVGPDCIKWAEKGD